MGGNEPSRTDPKTKLDAPSSKVAPLAPSLPGEEGLGRGGRYFPVEGHKFRILKRPW
ncbi:hypothetical protein FF011L_21220 [Roseimaritima multifibrata]|uniref:Uncharacterized protein n=1 Tax=Roseimaritima multifibrata TaxID=1930274 RepID=A0A517MER0_9BACT|nr:hypothetical protein FF011L_21220 [Roseimaritima multifibrata]